MTLGEMALRKKSFQSQDSGRYSEVETRATMPRDCSRLTFIASLLRAWPCFECLTLVNFFMPWPHFTVEGRRGTEPFNYRSLCMNSFHHTFYNWLGLASPSTCSSKARTMSGAASYLGAWQAPSRTEPRDCGRERLRQQGSSPVCSGNAMVLLSKYGPHIFLELPYGNLYIARVVPQYSKPSWRLAVEHRTES